jgi:tRNA threonylcarbamoyl adenosine modification protein (Sua5/YciO/YrdC/YwlC family)
VESLENAVLALQRGLVVAAPTESFFGLLADIHQRPALDALFTLKPRGADRGVPLLLPDRASWSGLVVELPDLARELADAFWPGPLTIVLPASPQVDQRLLNAGTVAVRLPGPCFAADVVRAFGRPLTATSANPPSATPPTRDTEVRAAFPVPVEQGRLLVAEGAAPGGQPSTLVAVEAAGLKVLREGAVTIEQLKQRFTCCVRANGF